MSRPAAVFRTAALHGASCAAALSAAVPARAQRADLPPPAGPPPIEDNSFLVEEAYNQERGVVQHIVTFAHPRPGPGWIGTFTQEWPLGGQAHQLSYTVAALRADATRPTPNLGDLALNYRYQVRDRGGVLFAPRATVVLPTGSARAGAGAGGVGLQTNLPLTLELSPHWAAHANAGGTVVPHGRSADGTPARSANVAVAGSVIWLARPTINVLIESLWTRTVTHEAGGARAYESQSVLSPGVRYAFNFAAGTQVVPGLAAPLTLRGSPRRARADVGVFAYLSVEHAFGRTR